FPAPDITDAVEGQPLNGGDPVTVALLTDTDVLAGPGAYSATIHWGDGSPDTAGTIVPDTAADSADQTHSHFFIQAVHTYAEESGPLTSTVVVQDNFGGKDQAETRVTGVADAPLIDGTAYPIFATEDQPLNDVPVATFIDTNPGATVADFTATINWGDSTPPV